MRCKTRFVDLRRIELAASPPLPSINDTVCFRSIHLFTTFHMYLRALSLVSTTGIVYRLNEWLELLEVVRKTENFPR
jgi:hypothetical protein